MNHIMYSNTPLWDYILKNGCANCYRHYRMDILHSMEPKLLWTVLPQFQVEKVILSLIQRWGNEPRFLSYEFDGVLVLLYLLLLWILLSWWFYWDRTYRSERFDIRLSRIIHHYVDGLSSFLLSTRQEQNHEDYYSLSMCYVVILHYLWIHYAGNYLAIK
jgi:hypothetical protein